ncbi:MAG: hypothetical protein ACYTGC_05735 [Planctomycetota bacterium]|jgi:hypothetical protein
MTVSPQSGDAPARESTRLSTLGGDRLCVGCGYNLIGQAIVREPHYGMLVARCPECGAMASLQEHPLPFRWSARYLAFGVAIWFAMIVLLFVISTAIIYGHAEGIAREGSMSYAQRLAEHQSRFLQRLSEEGNLPPSEQWLVANPPQAFSVAAASWLNAVDLDELLAQSGGWRSAADLLAFRQLTKMAVWAFMIGVFWSVALLHLRRRALLLVGFAMLGLAVAVALYTMFRGGLGGIVSLRLQGGGFTPMLVVAERQLGPRFYAWSLGLVVLPLAAGLWLGRPVTRGLIRAALPPRLRGPLAILWTSEGNDPPSVTPRTERRP